jgi:gliding motility-associated-like protein
MKISLFILLLYSSTLGYSQSFYNKGGIVSIQSGTVFTTKDSLVNTGTLTNNGNMVMGGVWFNQGTYNPGNGEITFNSATGSPSQIINHNNQTFRKLTISGGGQKVMLADMTIDGELILENGIITGQNNAKLKFTSTATISGASNNAHVKAPVVQSGSGQMLFPIGNGTAYLPVSITNISNATIEIEMKEENFNAITNFEIKELFTNRYWQLTEISGSAENSQLILPVFQLPQQTNTEKLIVAQADNATTEFSSVGQFSFTGTTANGTITTQALAAGNLVFAIGLASDLAGEVLVYNAISANNDGLNDYLEIANITNFPDNKLLVFNRWGDVVFELSGYNNTDKVFKGLTNSGSLLPKGTYFYKLELGNGSKALSGYISVK